MAVLRAIHSWCGTQSARTRARSAQNVVIKAGAAKELNWFTPQEGYGTLEADSKASVLGMVQGFFPYYSQDVREVVSWDSAKKAILDSCSSGCSSLTLETGV